MPGVLIKRGKFVYRNTDTRRGAHVKLKVEIGLMQLQAKCLSLFRWFLNNRNLFLTLQEAGNSRPKCQDGQVRALFCFLEFLLHPHMAERVRELSWTSLIRSSISFIDEGRVPMT